MINYGSFQVVRIVDVKKDFSDKTLTIPVIDIGPMNADFDHHWSRHDGNIMWKIRERLTSGVSQSQYWDANGRSYISARDGVEYAF